MRKADKILKLCNQYYSLIVEAAPAGVRLTPKGFLTPSVESALRPGVPLPEGPAVRPNIPTPVAAEVSGARLSGVREINLGETPGTGSPSIGLATEVGASPRPATPAQPSPATNVVIQQPKYNYEVVKLNEGEVVRKPTIGPDNKVNIYIDESGKIVADSFPKEIKDILGGERKAAVQLAKEIKSFVSNTVKSESRMKYEMAEFGDKPAAIKQLAAAYKSEIAMYTIRAIAAMIFIGIIWSKITKKEPRSKNKRVGKELKSAVDENSSIFDEVLQNTELKSKVDSISQLAKNNSKTCQNPANEQTLKSIYSLLDSISANLAFEDLTIDDKGSHEKMAEQLSKLNEPINSLINNKYLSRFAKFLESKNAPQDAELVKNCEEELLKYNKIINQLNPAIKDIKSA
jgi:hypothetical protein